MKSTLEHNIEINASREKIWEVLWGNDTYPKWTAAFSEGSKAVTDGWKKGSKVLFLDSKNDGMVALIADSNPPEYMSFEVIGEVKKGVEDTTSDNVKHWSGATENYFLTSDGGKTHLKITLTGVLDDFKEYMNQAWPKALEDLKKISEK